MFPVLYIYFQKQKWCSCHLKGNHENKNNKERQTHNKIKIVKEEKWFMKRKVFTIVTALTFALVGCQGNNQEGRTNDNNIEPTRSEQAGDGMNRDDRNYTMDRDGERNRDDQDIRNNLDSRDGDQNNETNQGNNNDRYDVAEEAAEQITDKIDEIDQAYVLTTNNNAYVAATLDTDGNNNNRNTDDHTNDNDTNNRNMTNNDQNNTNNQDGEQGEELTEDVKEEISDIVKSVDNNIDNVFVSTNPDFFDLTNNYVDDVNNDRPVRGFFDQMGNMIERLFPQNP